MAKDQEMHIKVSADIAEANRKIATLTKEIDKLKKASSKSTKNAASQEAAFKRVGAAADGLHKKLAAIVATYASIESVKGVVSAAAEIEEGFIGVAKTTGMTGEEMDKFKEKLYEMSTSMAGVKLEGLQQIAETAGQLGISGSDNILKFTEVITKMATTTDLSAEQAATSMAQLGNSLGIPVKNYENLGSAINELSNTTTASAGDLVNYAQRIAGTGKTFGLTADEVIAFSATLKDVGVSAELGGTAVSKMMMLMLQNTKDFAKVAGVSSDDFSRMIKDEPVKAIQLFLESLGKMEKSAKIKTLDDLKLSGSGAAQTMLKLSGATGKLSTALKTSSTAWKENTSLTKEYKTASEGFNAQFDRVGNSLKVIAGKIGEELLPKLKEMVDKFVEWINSMDDETIKKYADQIAGLAKTIGEIGGTIGKYAATAAGFVADNAKMIASIYLFTKALKIAQGSMVLFGAKAATMGATSASFVGASASMTTAVTSLWGGLTKVIGLAGPWGAAIAAVVGATAGAVELADNYTDSMKRAADADAKSAQTMEDHTAKIENIGEAYKKADEEVTKHGSITKETRDKIAAALQEEIDAIEKQLDAWQKSANTTDLQNKNAMALAGTLGHLKAKLDTLDADYSLKFDVDTTGVDEALARERAKAQEPIDTKLQISSNVDKVENDVKKLEKPTKSEHTIKSDIPKIEKEQEKLEKPTKSTHTVKSNVPAVEGEVRKLLTPTKSTHTVKGDTGLAIRAINALKVTTHSTHIVHVKKVYENSAGGLMPQRLAEGGVFRGYGRVPGYDPMDSDKVNAKLTGGEFVLRREAVDRYGADFLKSLNSLALPKFADGGAVGGSTGSGAVMANPAVVNLHIGGASYPMMADEEVAAALSRYMASEGGL